MLHDALILKSSKTRNDQRRKLNMFFLSPSFRSSGGKKKHDAAKVLKFRTEKRIKEG